MYPLTGRFLAALRSSHTAVVKVDAYLGATLLAEDLPVIGGSVSVDRASAVRRQLTITLADPTVLFPAIPDALAPYGVELHVWRGITFTSGDTELVPLGVFRIDDLSDTSNGGPVTLTGPDRAKAVDDAKFLIPEPSDTGNTVPEEITRLIQEALPGVAVVNVDVDDDLTPALVWDRDRWPAALDLAAGMGAELAFGPDGGAVLRAIPAISNPVAWLVDASKTGVMISASRKITRQETYNGVVAVGERSDGVAPARAFVSDDDPDSATYWEGAFGHVPFFFSSPIITTEPGATRAANGLLAAKRALGRSVSLSCVPNPALDVGDVIGVLLPDGTLERHMVDRLDIPLGVDAPMTIDTRTPDPTLVITDLPIEPSPEPVEDGWPEDPFPDMGLPGDPFPGDPEDPGPEFPATLTFEHTIVGPTPAEPAEFDFVIEGGNGCTIHVSYVSTAVVDGTTSFTYHVTQSAGVGGTRLAAFGYGLDGEITATATSASWGTGDRDDVRTIVIQLPPGSPVGYTLGTTSIEEYNLGGDGVWQLFPPGPFEPTNETFPFEYLPQTLPEVVVELDGIELDPTDVGYDIDYLAGVFTVLPAMGATVGQVLTITYTTNGEPPPLDDDLGLFLPPEPAPLIGDLP